MLSLKSVVSDCAMVRKVRVMNKMQGLGFFLIGRISGGLVILALKIKFTCEVLKVPMTRNFVQLLLIAL